MIFDFDGVIADSEAISLATLRTALAHDGIVRSADDVRDAFLGKSLSAICTYVADHTSTSVAEGFAQRWEHTLFAAFRDTLAPMDGVDNLLDHLTETNTPYCVASSGTFERIGIALDAMGLTDRFPHVFSAEQVAHGKPAPDLFLHAARQMQVRPDVCLVIEDSPYGVCAAQAANMTCIGFIGGGHLDGIAERHGTHLTAQGAGWVISSHAALLPHAPSPGTSTA